MAVTTTKTNKPLNPRGNDQSPKGYNRAALYSGKALDFDGVNDYVDLDGFTMSGNTGTFVFNLKMDDWNALRFIFDANSQRLVIGTGDNGNEIGVYDSTAWKMFGTITDTINTNNFAIVVDGTTAKCFLNGQSFGTEQTITAINLTNPTNVALGSRNTGTASFLNGQIAGFKIFNTALTAAQVADLYNNPEKIVPTGVSNDALKLWLPMQEGAGTTAYDGSGNGNHGTISGATYTHGIGAPVSQTAVIDWNKGTNLLAYSGQLQETSEYTRDTITVTANTDEAPNGITEATTLEDTSSSGYAKIQSDPSTTGGTTYYAGIYVKKATSAVSHYPGFQFDTNSKYVIFDNYNGTYNTVSGGANDYDSIEIQNVDSNWWRILVEVTANASSERFAVWPAISSNGTSISASATGSNVFWGASLSTSKLYTPTIATAQTSPVLLPQGLTTGRDITGVNPFENVRKQGALNLDGNSWAEVHDNASLDLTSALTMEAWVYWDLNGASASGIMGKWFPSNWGFLFFTNAATLTFYISNVYPATASVSHTFTANGWYHLVGTDDGTTIRLYIDGVQVGSTSSLGSIVDTSRELEIGRYNDSANNTYNDSIAQPRIYNRALTAEEVERNYNAGKNIYTNS